MVSKVLFKTVTELERQRQGVWGRVGWGVDILEFSSLLSSFPDWGVGIIITMAEKECWLFTKCQMSWKTQQIPGQSFHRILGIVVISHFTVEGMGTQRD